MNVAWSKVQHTELAKIAKAIIYKSPHLQYHNMLHVKSMYQYLHDTNEPYDEALDWAILFHDIVYDKEPKKEWRSSLIFSTLKDKYKGCNLSLYDVSSVTGLIMATETHLLETGNLPRQYSAIIRADLHGLADPVSTFYNFGSIMKESMFLYDIDECEFAKNSEMFMNALYDRVHDTMNNDIYDHRDFYHDVLGGIDSTIQLSKIIRGL